MTNASSLPTVVAAVQSPTLLNILARSSSWKLFACPLGDHENLTEFSALEVPTWQPEHGNPQAVLVCSPAHLFSARARWPLAKIFWLVHNGRERWLLPAEHEDSVSGAIVFSERLRWLCQAGRRTKFHFVSPAYAPAADWSWAEDRFWTLRNRPLSRSDDRENLIAALTEDRKHTFYGQEQRAGFAGPSAIQSIRSSCSAYISALDRSAGFGLAEHECLASGVPIIGGWWGDLDEELSRDYWALRHDPREMRRSVDRAALQKEDCELLSRLGIEYIKKYRTPQRMDETVSEIMARL